MFRPDRLVSARALTGSTQTELAAASGIGQPMISMIEKHQRDFTEEHAKAFAAAMSLPIKYFSVIPRSIPRDSLHYRKQSRAKVGASYRVHELFAEAFRPAEMLLQNSGYPRQMLPTVQNIEPMLDRAVINEIAGQVRVTLGIDPVAPITNVTRALERGGIVVAPIQLPDTEILHHSGVSWSAGRGETAMIGIMPSRGDRDRFTLAHELGHLVLHSFRQSEDPELEADLFAGAFLLPEQPMRDTLPGDATLKALARMKAVWGVSIQAMLMRANTLELLSPEREATLWKQLSARGWRRDEPVEVKPETPRLLFKLLQQRFGASSFHNSAMARELALPVFTLRSLAPPPPTSHPEGPQPVRAVARLHPVEISDGAPENARAFG